MLDRNNKRQVCFNDALNDNNNNNNNKRMKIINNDDNGEIENFAVLTSLDVSKYNDIKIPFKDVVKIGRSTSKNNDIIIKNNDVSSIHCIFKIIQHIESNFISVQDLSSNGTFVNNILIGKSNSSILRNGDRLSIASDLHYIVNYENNFKPLKTSFFEKYILTDKILGTGHYAQVKEAKNRQSGIVCAVKIFNPTSNHTQSVQLNRELEILININHPNIVGFYDTFIEPISINTSTTFLVLEKINGGELFNRIVAKGKLRQNETNEIINQLLKGLQYLHSIDIVHRDLKPENILLSITPTKIGQLSNDPWDENEFSIQVKIADFGLAKFIGKFQFTTTLCGTPAYVAPEVLENSQTRKYNKSVDMWSVGVLIYVCLCGFPPFSEELGPPSMRQQISQAKYAFYSPYWDEIDDIVLDLISRLLVLNPDERLTVDETINHPWFTAKKQSLPIQHLDRIQNSSGYDCEPITIQERANTGLTDELIAQKYCK